MANVTQTASRYVARLLKGSALLPQMRTLVRLWREDTDAEAVIAEIIRYSRLGNVSRKRVRDIVQLVFVPRYVQGNPPDAWRILQAFEEAQAPLSVVRPLYYLFAARSDPFIGDFVREVLFERYYSGVTSVQVADVLRFISEAEEDGRIAEPWSESVRIRVAQHLLAALRDFGVLEGRAKKRVAAPYLPVVSFACAAFLFGLESRGGVLLDHPDWRLFLLGREAVERLFIEADGKGLLHFNAAGSIVRIEFPEEDINAYSRFLAARAAQTA